MGLAHDTIVTRSSRQYSNLRMPKPYIHGEILPPLSRSIETVQPAESPLASDEDLNAIATWLDDRFVIPVIGTPKVNPV